MTTPAESFAQQLLQNGGPIDPSPYPVVYQLFVDNAVAIYDLGITNPSTIFSSAEPIINILSNQDDNMAELKTCHSSCIITTSYEASVEELSLITNFTNDITSQDQLNTLLSSPYSDSLSNLSKYILHMIAVWNSLVYMQTSEIFYTGNMNSLNGVSGYLMPREDVTDQMLPSIFYDVFANKNISYLQIRHNFVKIIQLFASQFTDPNWKSILIQMCTDANVSEPDFSASNAYETWMFDTDAGSTYLHQLMITALYYNVWACINILKL
jgi:hypothetical protein